MMTIDLNSGKCEWIEENPGRAVCPQTAVHPVLNILYSEGEHDRKAEVNGALGTERPTRISRRFFETFVKEKRKQTVIILDLRVPSS